jgi:hypothetical protein
MNASAVPLVVALLLVGGAGGAATWALAGHDSRDGNSAPIDDNHRGTPPSPTSVPATPAASPRVTASPADVRPVAPAADDRGTREPEPGDDRGTREPEPGDDSGGHGGYY